MMNHTKYLAGALFAGIVSATTSALAAQPSAIATLSLSAPFGTSPLVSWSWAGLSGDGGISRPILPDLSVTRYSDGQSPLLVGAMAVGQYVERLELADGPTTITLREVVVTGYSTADSSDRSAPRTEIVTFGFSNIEYTVNGVRTCFDVKRALRC